MNTSVLRKYNLNYIAIMIGVLFLIRTIVLTATSSYYDNYAIRAIITIAAGIIGLSGIMFFNRDYKISIAQYAIGCIGLILGDLTGIYTFFFFILAIFLAYVERGKSENNSGIECHEFGQDDKSKSPPVKKKSFVYVPCISLLILIILFASSMVLSDMESDARLKAINVTELKADSNIEYDYPKVNLTGKLISSQTFTSVSVKTYWYDQAGTQISETYDRGIHSQIKENQTYQLNTEYYGQKGDQLPSKAEIVVEDLKRKQIIYSKNVTV